MLPTQITTQASSPSSLNQGHPVPFQLFMVFSSTYRGGLLSWICNRPDSPVNRFQAPKQTWTSPWRTSASLIVARFACNQKYARSRSLVHIFVTWAPFLWKQIDWTAPQNDDAHFFANRRGAQVGTVSHGAIAWRQKCTQPARLHLFLCVESAGAIASCITILFKTRTCWSSGGTEVSNST